MKALFTAEIYRLFRQKSTYIILILSFVFLTFNACMLGLALGNAPWLQEIHDNLLTSGVLEEYYGSAFLEQYQQVMALRPDSAAEFIALNFRGDLVFFLAFFSLCFSASEKKYGFVQQYAPLHKRARLFTVHSLILFLFSACMLVLSFFGILLASQVFFMKMPFGNGLLLLGYLLVLLIIYAAVGNLMLVVFDLIRSTRLAGILIFFYLLIGSSFLYSLLDTVFSGVGAASSVRIMLPVGSLSVISYTNPGTIAASVFPGVVFLGLTFLLELFYFRRRDLMV